jgi:uncharacterized peroxidase-related enzyme
MFIGLPAVNDAAARLHRNDMQQLGYVMNLTRVWAWRPDVYESFVGLRSQVTEGSTLSARELAVMVCASAASLGDSYCALAWGRKLAALASPEIAAAVLSDGEDPGMSPRERALATWSRQVVMDPNGALQRDVDALRKAGLDEREIFEATVFTALRLAFSTVNDALGLSPDAQVAQAAPPEVRRAVRFGRPPLSVDAPPPVTSSAAQGA